MRGMIIIQFNDFAYLAEGEHYMNEKQYLRANKRVFLAVTIIFAYITLTMLAALAASHGDHFVISVLSNVAPTYVHEMCYKFFSGDIAGSCKMQLDALPLIDALFCEVNPIPVKAALNMMGKEVGTLRAPLTEMEDAHKEVLRKAMADLGLIQ